MRSIVKRGGALLMAGSLLCLTACGKEADNLRTLQELIDSASMRENDVHASSYTLYAENSRLEFWFNEDTTAFEVVGKSDGHRWRSANPARADDTAENAVIALTYLRDGGLTGSMDSMSDAVKKGQYSFQKSGNGVQVTYDFGALFEATRLPQALSVQRFQEILERIEDDFQYSKVEGAYQHIDAADCDEDGKKEWLKRYPALAEQSLYILRDDVQVSERQQKELSDILQESGYTEEHYQEDAKLFSSESGTADKPAFRITVQYALTEEGLQVTVPVDAIRSNANYPLLRVDLLKYFGSPSDGTAGYFLLPDGSGSLMNFYNGKGQYQPYQVTVYGTDESMADSERVYDFHAASLPVFGIAEQDHGMLAWVTRGGAAATIHAYPGEGSVLPYAHASFAIRKTYQSSLQTENSGKSDAFLIVQDSPLKGDIQVTYTILEGEDSDYNGMAAWLRERLFTGRKPLQPAAPPAVTEYVGMTREKAQVMGIGYQKDIVMSTYEQVRAATEELLAGGVGHLFVRMSGWTTGGYRHTYAGNTQVLSQLGGETGLERLAAWLAEETVGFFPDIDLQYTYSTQLFDGFQPKRDSVTLINKAAGKAYAYNPATFERDPGLYGMRYIHNPAAIRRAADGFRALYEKFPIDGLSLRVAGQEVNADYSSDSLVDRQAAAEELAAVMAGFSEQYDLMTKGANAYALPYADCCTDVPLTSNYMSNTDESVPFLQMVMSGYVWYCGPAMNLSGANRSDWLRLAAVAGGVSYMLTAQQAEEVRQGEDSFLFSSDFGAWKGRLLDDVTAYQQAMAGLSGRPITAYDKLQEGVYRTSFDGGGTVTVNYGDGSVVIDGVTIPPQSYVTARG